MPIGPSHGSRGGGGDRDSRSSGGGGNLLGSIVGGVIGGMLTAGARRRRRHYREERYHHRDGGSYENEPATPSRRKPTGFLILAIITLFITFFTFSIRNGFVHSAETQNKYIATMKSDWSEYKELFDKAEEQEALADTDPTKTHFITTATFSQQKHTSYEANPTNPGIYYDFTLNNVQYYFIVYSYFDASGASHTGTTYSQFSANQADGFSSSIEVAYTVDSNGQYVSMNTGYNLENCAEYKYRLAMVEANKQLAGRVIIAIVVEILLIALFVFLFIKKLKKYKALIAQDEVAYTQKQQAEVDEAQAKAEAAQAEADSKNRICAFCGSNVPDGETSCPACGSNTFE